MRGELSAGGCCCTRTRNHAEKLCTCRTGCGKTLAFVLPIVERLATGDAAKQPARGRKPRVIVLTPTRELAKQVGPLLLLYLS